MGTVQWKYYKAIKALKISLGNLTASLLFAIVFVISQITRRKENISQDSITTTQKNEQYVNQVTESETKKENDTEETMRNLIGNVSNNENLENVIQIPQETILNREVNNGYLLGISGVFLMISIAFFIIFQIRQQKRRMKTSK